MRRTPMIAATALAVAASALSFAAPAAARASHHIRCSLPRPEYSPGDLLYKQAPVSASARLALAIRWRTYLQSCHRG